MVRRPYLDWVCQTTNGSSKRPHLCGHIFLKPKELGDLAVGQGKVTLSDDGQLGGVVSQDGKPIPAQTRCTTTERELLSVRVVETLKDCWQLERTSWTCGWA